VLSPATDIPCESFIDLLNKKGIVIHEVVEQSK
jgi:hypothetical protein